MEKIAAKKLIQDTFENAFDKTRFSGFVKNLLNHIEETPQTVYQGNYIPDAFKDYIQKLERIGKYQAPDGKRLDILIINLKKTTSLERARSMQRNYVADYLARRGEKDAALVAFVSPDPADWRFSFVKMEYKFKETQKGVKAVEEFTPARRYSFLVGEHENSHTAQTALVPLLLEDDSDPELSRIEACFNVEKVTKEFFEKYRELFIKTKEALDKLIEKDQKIQKDFADNSVDPVDFAKKTIGQIVFLYFLQKKGWFGVPRQKDWGEGDKRFLRTLFEEAREKRKNYFNDYLEPLFYNALAVKRPYDYYDRFDCKIPFLNGGLFDPINNYNWYDTDINLPNELFSNSEKTKEGDTGNGILDIFDRYNFTVKEDEPLEKEVAVDPEMLGKVFENLLEVKDRKSKGTYYTPREIVHYMCRESLINYLATELEGKVTQDDLRTLITEGESFLENDLRVLKKGEETKRYTFKLPQSIRDNARLIDEKLASIKVCDPAIGSGAFPVGMMTEIVRARKVVFEIQNPGKSAPVYDFKRQAIQESLYGVDIDPGAVEIAKLRLWLSLIVDEEDIKTIKPLPNLDFKIMQGNSLLEEYEGIRLFDDKILAGGVPDAEKQLETAKEKQRELSNEYISLHSANKLSKPKKLELDAKLKEVKDLINKLTKQSKAPSDAPTTLFDRFSEARKKAEELLDLKKQFFETSDKEQKDALKQDIEDHIYELIKASLKEQNKGDKIAEIERFRKTNVKPFFLWKLNFSEVFQQKGGFDVVIANPPYLEARSPEFSNEMKIGFQNNAKARWGNLGENITRGADLLIYFYELSIYLIHKAGSVVFITQNSWLDTDYGKKFQDFLLKTTFVQAIIDSDFKYFDSKLGPNINTIISIFFGRQPNIDDFIYFARFHENYEDIRLSIDDIERTGDKKILDVHKFKYSDNILREIKWGILLNSEEEVIDLLVQINKLGYRLDQIKDFELTIGQGLNLTKDCQVEESVLKKFPALKKCSIPFMTTSDGAPFELKATKYFLIDSNKINDKKLTAEIKALGYKLFDSSSTGKITPLLILPRGVSKHFCCFNSISAYSSSYVDIYDNKGNLPEEAKLNLWLFLNSSIGWLLREASGRKSLGGGLLKAEATDLRSFPIFFEFKAFNEIKNIFNSMRNREALNYFDELNSVEHKRIDQIVFTHLQIEKGKQNRLLEILIKLLKNRTEKSKT